VGDQYSGQVASFAASGGEVASEAVCTGGEFFDWAAGVTCAGEAP
jgi:hypothetical protein